MAKKGHPWVRTPNCCTVSVSVPIAGDISTSAKRMALAARWSPYRWGHMPAQPRAWWGDPRRVPPPPAPSPWQPSNSARAPRARRCRSNIKSCCFTAFHGKFCETLPALVSHPAVTSASWFPEAVWLYDRSGPHFPNNLCGSSGPTSTHPCPVLLPCWDLLVRNAQFSFFTFLPTFKLLGNYGYYRNKGNTCFHLALLTKEVTNQE